LFRDQVVWKVEKKRKERKKRQRKKEKKTKKKEKEFESVSDPSPSRILVSGGFDPCSVKRAYLLRTNSDLDVLGLFGKLRTRRIRKYPGRCPAL
jgi:hypothetical protein